MSLPKKFLMLCLGDKWACELPCVNSVLRAEVNCQANSVVNNNYEDIVQTVCVSRTSDTTLDSTIRGKSPCTVEGSTAKLDGKSRIILTWKNTKNASALDQLYVVQNSTCNLQVWFREFPNSRPKLLLITEQCVRGTCTCQHYIRGRLAQLYPCRLFVELFMRGDTDPDWFYLLSGFFFGFHVINPDCIANYKAGKFKNKSDWENDIIN